MSRLGLTWATLAVAVLAAACRPAASNAGRSPAEANAGRSPAEATFKSRCQSCHRLPEPDERTGDQWRDWLTQHRRKAGLTDEQLELVLTYLTLEKAGL